MSGHLRPDPAGSGQVDPSTGDGRPADLPRLAEPVVPTTVRGPGGRRDVHPAAVEELVTTLAGTAAETWGEVLATHGRDALWLRRLVATYRRELWLWLVGERRWDAVEAGLAGRVARRLSRP